MAYTISKKIILARALVKQPKLLILEDPLDHFDKEEATKLINLLASPQSPWSLVVVSNNGLWDAKCNKHIELKNGFIINKL